ncbi:MAG: flagellar basal body rod protein FlgB [Balneolaceae bacterium]|nr:MAG: flagellar basal body rod protein FlgB [Balneolaceae bacterium]
MKCKSVVSKNTQPMKFIDSNHSQLLARAMDTYSLRQRVTAANIANIDTPGYKKKEVKFEDELRRVQEAGKMSRATGITPRIVETDDELILEDQLIEQSDTQIRVNLVTRSLRMHFELLKNGITGINR